MSAATHIVAKPFEVAAGKRLEAGTEVDASTWRNTDNLVKHRYLKPIIVNTAPQSKEAPRQQSGNQQRR